MCTPLLKFRVVATLKSLDLIISWSAIVPLSNQKDAYKRTNLLSPSDRIANPNCKQSRTDTTEQYLYHESSIL